MKNKLLIIFLSIIFIFSGEKNENKIKINMKNILKTDSIKIADENKIRVAVSAMVSPKSTFKYYKEILDYIGKKLGKEVELVQRKSYHEVNKLLENKEIDFAFVCSGPYVTGSFLQYRLFTAKLFIILILLFIKIPVLKSLKI